ncbi:MAG: RagB/SusD family nutrient uptake outer membrane protein [Pseudobacter sp.]|uniref:RagB/SusD family nutrient uptake outer membrane protein n=1 Tax=Pseudobacter sp. TaxID=2045420 RepID=UPI003F7D5764
MNLRIFYLFIAIITMGSCKKFLESRSQSEMTPETTDDYSALLFNEGYSIPTTYLYSGIQFMDDDLQCYSYPTAQDDPITAEKPLGAFSWQWDFARRIDATGLASLEVTNSYKKYYDLIAGCNIALDNVDGSVGTQAEKDQLKGEALALRAFYYFNLANLYGNPYNDSTTTPDQHLAVPLILSSGLSEKMPFRNTVAEVYAQIEKDLNQANELLEKGKRMSSYRFNYLASHLLTSRIGLFTEKWQEVITHADRVISVHPTIIDLNTWPEYYYMDPFIPVCTKPNEETLWLFSDEKDFQDINASMLYSISEDLASKFEATDIRTTHYFSELPEFLRMYAPVRYSSNKRNLENAQKFSGSALRVSEAYLNRAEAYAQLYIKTGDVAQAQKALDDLNFLRSKRFRPADFQPLTLMTGPELLQFCRDERRRELFSEGHRWYDLRRYGMPAIKHVYQRKGVADKIYQLNAHDPQYTLQLPDAATNLNFNLIQNPKGPTRVPLN